MISVECMICLDLTIRLPSLYWLSACVLPNTKVYAGVNAILSTAGKTIVYEYFRDSCPPLISRQTLCFGAVIIVFIMG